MTENTARGWLANGRIIAKDEHAEEYLVSPDDPRIRRAIFREDQTLAIQDGAAEDMAALIAQGFRRLPKAEADVLRDEAHAKVKKSRRVARKTIKCWITTTGEGSIQWWLGNAAGAVNRDNLTLTKMLQREGYTWNNLKRRFVKDGWRKTLTFADVAARVYAVERAYPVRIELTVDGEHRPTVDVDLSADAPPAPAVAPAAPATTPAPGPERGAAVPQIKLPVHVGYIEGIGTWLQSDDDAVRASAQKQAWTWDRTIQTPAGKGAYVNADRNPDELAASLESDGWPVIREFPHEAAA